MKRTTTLFLVLIIVFVSACGGSASSSVPDAADPVAEFSQEIRDPQQADYSDPLQEVEQSTDSHVATWDSDLFTRPAYEFNSDLACICAYFSKASYDVTEALKSYRDYGFDGCEHYNYMQEDSLGNYSGANCFTMAHDVLNIDGVETTILVINCRGTNSDITMKLDLFKSEAEFHFDIGEILGDVMKGDFRNLSIAHSFLGCQVWDNVYDYYEEVMTGLDIYLNKFPQVEEAENLKVLVTGHSLGGAAANMVGADITEMLNNEEDVYVYTFGAINVITRDENESEYFENIHNIYNYYDSFGPNGNFAFAKASSPYAKFGHTEIYDQKRLHYEEYGASWFNHDIKNYIAAVELHRATGNVLDLNCEVPEYVYSDNYPDPGHENNERSGEIILNGTYVSDGLVPQKFTFYPNGEMEMNAFGIIGSGHYTISGGILYAEYAISLLGGAKQTWQPTFQMESEDVIYIAGDRFVRQ